MKAGYGKVVEVKKLRSQNVTRIMIEIPAEFHKEATELLDEADVLVTVAPMQLRQEFPYGILQPDSQPVAPPEQDAPAEFGHLARRLKTDGFFRNPRVLERVGLDADYQDWCRAQPCAICGSGDLVQDTGELRCQYAHVRRASNAGTGIKPLFSGLPLCTTHHGKQHQNGELAALIGYTKAPIKEAGEAKIWFEKQAVAHAEEWAWQKLKHDLGYASWTQVPPDVLVAWADDNEVLQYLPACYREAVA